MSKSAAQMLVDTIEATGGLLRFRHGNTAPAGDPDWIDLGAAYEQACLELGRTPQVQDDEEVDE